jgi:uncharacterized phage-associated protein
MQPSITFKLNEKKAIASLVWIIQNGETDLFNAMKILFEADKHHLNTYGRPVTGDRYVAWDHGTVPYWTYYAIRRREGGVYRKSGEGGRRGKNALALESWVVFDDEEFSESDVISLQVGFDKYAGKGFGETETINHLEPAWKNAVARRAIGQRQTDILFEEMIEGKPRLVKHLQEIGHLLTI